MVEMLAFRPDFVAAACAILQACPATDALARVQADLQIPGKPLGIVTPPAAQGASFEKNGGPYPGSVVDGKTLDIENNAGHIGQENLSPQRVKQKNSRPIVSVYKTWLRLINFLS
jgi:hypothetical protein